MSEQRSEQWFLDRAGKITASRFCDAIAMNKRDTTKPTEARNTYMRELAAEILSGSPNHEISSKSLSWGTELESYSREAYELETGNFIVESPFVVHPEFDFIGCSPDGLVSDSGGLEMKCPLSEAVHVKTWLEGMPDDHIGQVQGCMFVTGRKWWDFVSYQPRQSEKYRLYIQRIPRDDDYIDNTLKPGLLAFWADLQAMLETIRAKAK